MLAEREIPSLRRIIAAAVNAKRKFASPRASWRLHLGAFFTELFSVAVIVAMLVVLRSRTTLTVRSLWRRAIYMALIYRRTAAAVFRMTSRTARSVRRIPVRGTPHGMYRFARRLVGIIVQEARETALARGDAQTND